MKIELLEKYLIDSESWIPLVILIGSLMWDLEREDTEERGMNFNSFFHMLSLNYSIISTYSFIQ